MNAAPPISTGASSERIARALGGPALRGASAVVLALLITARPLTPDSSPQPVVLEINLEGVVQPVSEEYVVAGIREANRMSAAAVILDLSTPGGLDTSMRAIIKAIISSRVPVITYVAPSGSRAASAGFFILLSGDVAAMAPGTNTGAAHPVLIGGSDVGKTMEAKIENDAAAYLRSIAGKRGRNVKLAEEGVRQSKAFTEKEALENRLIDVVANTPQDLLAQLNGRTLQRFDGSTTVLRLSNARIEPYRMSERQQFLSWIADPNVAFVLGLIGLLCLYIEFSHPGMVVPGVVGALAIILALFAFHLLPINYTGVALIVLALILFVLEAKVGSHGVLAAGGAVAMIVGSLILVDSPWPAVRIRLSTSLAVTLPVTLIAMILLRAVLAAKRQKAITGEAGMIDSVGVARTDLEPRGQVLIRGELWQARADEPIPSGTRVRVRQTDGLTLVVEPDSKPAERSR
jgi:membrane-bound serine protease (ClpP class)